MRIQGGGEPCVLKECKLPEINRMLVSLPVLFTTLLGGYVLGFVFAALKLPLPVPPFAGLIAAAACLGGSESFELIRQNWLS